MEQRPYQVPYRWSRAWWVAVATCLGFVVLGALTRYSLLQSLDLRVTREAQESRSPLLQSLMLAATFLGNAATLVTVAALVSAALWSARLRKASGFVLLCLAGLPADLLLKEFWRRARPDESLVHVAIRYSGSSFPSGHAMGGTMLYGGLAALAWLHLPKGPARLTATAALAALPLVVDASRVYLGAHWLSDVVGGSAVACALLLLLIRWYGDRIATQRDDDLAAETGGGPKPFSWKRHEGGKVDRTPKEPPAGS